MSHPTSRVLAVLELLQSRGTIGGPELASRLETDVRTIRRYVTILQDIGIPIEATPGRHGGYRLMPGFKLPPLLFTEEEATAIVLGLLGTSWLEVGHSSVAIEGALAKVYRVLPMSGRERIEAMSSHMYLFPHERGARPNGTLLAHVSGAIQGRQRLAIDYRSQHSEHTHRKVEPYGIVGWQGHWFLVAYCCLRHDFRTFRLDRVEMAEVLTETFVKDEQFDSQAYIKTHAMTLGRYAVTVEFQADLATVQQNLPGNYGTLTTTPMGVILEDHTDNLDVMARYLMLVNLPFIIHSPDELRDALWRMAEQIATVARADVH